MSQVIFIASDVKVDDLINTYVKHLSVNEAIALNIDVHHWLLNREDLDRDKKVMLYMESEECMHELEIRQVQYHPEDDMAYYSGKTCFSEVNVKYSKERSIQFIEYLSEQLIKTKEIEVWKIWADERKDALVRRIEISAITDEHIHWLMQNGYTEPMCLVVSN